MEPIIIVFTVLSIALIIALAIEYVEYRRYRKAAYALIALGEGMKGTFNDIISEVNKQGLNQNLISQGLLAQDQDLVFVKAILEIHSEALGLRTLKQWQEASLSGEESSGKVSG